MFHPLTQQELSVITKCNGTPPEYSIEQTRILCTSPHIPPKQRERIINHSSYMGVFNDMNDNLYNLIHRDMNVNQYVLWEGKYKHYRTNKLNVILKVGYRSIVEETFLRTREREIVRTFSVTLTDSGEIVLLRNNFLSEQYCIYYPNALFPTFNTFEDMIPYHFYNVILHKLHYKIPTTLPLFTPYNKYYNRFCQDSLICKTQSTEYRERDVRSLQNLVACFIMSYAWPQYYTSKIKRLRAILPTSLVVYLEQCQTYVEDDVRVHNRYKHNEILTRNEY
jgi:hypothetical protein